MVLWRKKRREGNAGGNLARKASLSAFAIWEGVECVLWLSEVSSEGELTTFWCLHDNNQKSGYAQSWFETWDNELGALRVLSQSQLTVFPEPLDDLTLRDS